VISQIFVDAGNIIVIAVKAAIRRPGIYTNIRHSWRDAAHLAGI